MALARWRSPRLWTVAASLLTRGAGFITSFALSRLAGIEALGAYSVVVNTASAVVAPVAGVMGNNATLLVADRHAQRKPSSAVAMAQLLLAAVLVLLCWLVLRVFGAPTLDKVAQPGLHGWMTAAAASVIFGQMMMAVVQGCYAGQGRFRVAALVSASVSLVVVLCIAPVLAWWSVRGAYALLIAASCVPALLLMPALAGRAGGDATAPRDAVRMLWAGLPVVGAIAMDTLAGWYCSIHLVQKTHGVAGVGVVAIAAQWLTLMLIPATSWGGMTLKTLKDAAGSADSLRAAVAALVRRNLSVTVPLGAAIAAAGWLIAAAYGLRGTALPLLIAAHALLAAVWCVNNVLERVFLCLGRQRTWLVISAVAFGVQALSVTWWISHGVVIVVLGSLLANLCMLALAAWSVRGVLRRAPAGSRA